MGHATTVVFYRELGYAQAILPPIMDRYVQLWIARFYRVKLEYVILFCYFCGFWDGTDFLAKIPNDESARGQDIPLNRTECSIAYSTGVFIVYFEIKLRYFLGHHFMKQSAAQEEGMWGFFNLRFAQLLPVGLA